MARIEIPYNPDDDKGGGWTPLPAGTMDFQVTGKESSTSGSGNPQIKVSFEVAKAADDGLVGKKASDFFTITPKASWRIKQFLEALDVDYDFNEQSKVISFDDDDLLDRYFQATVEQETYNGKLKNNFGSFAPSTLAGPRAADPGPQAAPVAQSQPVAAQAPSVQQPVAAPASSGGVVRRRSTVATT